MLLLQHQGEVFNSAQRKLLFQCHHNVLMNKDKFDFKRHNILLDPTTYFVSGVFMIQGGLRIGKINTTYTTADLILIKLTSHLFFKLDYRLNPELSQLKVKSMIDANLKEKLSLGPLNE